MKAQPVRRGIEQADERGDEAVRGQPLGELVVDAAVGELEIRAQAQRHAQHGVHLRHGKRRPDAVAGGVAEHDEQSLLGEREIESVAAGEIGGAERAVEIVARHLRHGRGQRAHLHHARGLHLAAQLLALDHLLHHQRALQRHGALRGEHAAERLVGGVEHAVALVEHLHHAHQRFLVIDERQREQAARAVAALAIDPRIEARIGVAVGHVDQLARARAGADDAGAGRHAHRRDVGRHAQHELVAVGFVEPYRGALGAEHLRRRIHHLDEHRREVVGRGELAGERENRLEIGHPAGNVLEFGDGARTRRRPSRPPRRACASSPAPGNRPRARTDQSRARRQSMGAGLSSR